MSQALFFFLFAPHQERMMHDHAEVFLIVGMIHASKSLIVLYMVQHSVA